jgi:hypothetical protein
VRPSVSVAVPDPFAARDLEGFLARLEPGVVEHDGDWCVAVEQGDDATLVEVLSAVEAWLVRSGLRSARVTVGERSYVMQPHRRDRSGRPLTPRARIPSS